MREYKGAQYWSVDDCTDEEMEAIHNMGMDDKSREIRKRLAHRKGWDTLPQGLCKRDNE